MTPIKCFFLEPTDQSDRILRRFKLGDDDCPLRHGYHNAEAVVGRFPALLEDSKEIVPDVSHYSDDPRWPDKCECGYEFLATDEWQVNTARVYKSATQEGDYFLKRPVPGMMYDAPWFSNWKGPDGRTLIVICPDGAPWIIDSQANNCTMVDDHNQERHHCWIRHGEPPNLTVDKNGVTCAAGAGSIQTRKWHGFLREGFLVE